MRVLVLFLILVATLHSQAQSDTIARYWINSTPTNVKARAKTVAKYYRKDGLWYMESRFLSNGGIYLTGTYLEREAKTRVGEFRWYYENGRLSEVNRYVNNKVEGLVLGWHENGVLKDSVTFQKGKIVGKGFVWNDQGQVVTVYDLDEQGNGEVKTFRNKDSLYSQGRYVEGSKSGIWKYYAPEGYLEWEVDYLKDSVLHASCFDSKGLAQNDCIFEQEAIPPGGLAGWKKYLERVLTNANYPSRKLSKKEKNLSGSVWVRFLVEKDGSISDIQIINSLNEEADSIVYNAMLNAPRWKAGIFKNKPVRSYHSQPVNFNVVDE